MATHRATVKPEHEMNFLMAYECLMMWAIRRGMEHTLSAIETESAVGAMQRHIAKNGYYQAGTFERIWAEVQKHMSFMAMADESPGAPPPYPFADMLMAAKFAGYEIEAKSQEFFDLRFGMYVALLMSKLKEATEHAAEDFKNNPT